ncbi:hypothetical protein TL16_g09872 [Triparma laevis f. inornata]|uniref:NADH:ubiquinone reductase (non-electrogenic) n=1 Tax=Triparma laevis f. inornata TaxID=1714386 RepID=A0A9W7B5K7_9STRA|nr:hypothetical protein TL16_g09872 [Triparma laevis f. inornata]
MSSRATRIAISLLLLASTISFQIPLRSHLTSNRLSHIYSNPDSFETEKILRQTLEKQNEGDGQAPSLSTSPSTPVETPPPPTTTSPKKTYTVPSKYFSSRPYPKFLLEKAFELYDDLTYSPPSSDSVTKTKSPHVVILGTGWGSSSFLKTTANSGLNITVISPRNFFLFTPMLAGASVGTVEPRSITEPVRSLNPDAQFLEATAKTVDQQKKQIECESVICEGNSCTISTFSITYDYLIISIGCTTNTYGIPGVLSNCNFLKSIEDARRIRTGIVNCFERAGLPGLNDKQIKDTLTFAIIGAGPTGVEFASELRDFVEAEGPKYYPTLLKYVRIKIIEASDTVLAPFDEKLREKAIEELTRTSKIKYEKSAVKDLLPPSLKLTELMLQSGVREITKSTIILNDDHEVPYGLSVWAAGNGPMPFTLNLIKTLQPEQQTLQSIARGRIAVDPWLRVIGSDGSLISLGDCACNVDDVLPGTAQVAGQQGEWLGKMFRREYDFIPEGEVVGRGEELSRRSAPRWECCSCAQHSAALLASV